MISQGVQEIMHASQLYLDPHDKATLAGIANHAVFQLAKVRDHLRG